jgi:hypothetical protein
MAIHAIMIIATDFILRRNLKSYGLPISAVARMEKS